MLYSSEGKAESSSVKFTRKRLVAAPQSLRCSGRNPLINYGHKQHECGVTRQPCRQPASSIASCPSSNCTTAPSACSLHQIKICLCPEIVT